MLSCLDHRQRQDDVAVALAAALCPLACRDFWRLDTVAAADARRFLHDHEARALQRLHDAIGDDGRDHIVGVMPALLAFEPSARTQSTRRGRQDRRA